MLGSRGQAATARARPLAGGRAPRVAVLVAGVLAGSGLARPPGGGDEPGGRPLILDAGPDLSVEFPSPVELRGTVSGLSPVHFWAGDGNADTENKIITYSDSAGFGAFGPLRRQGSQTVFGWPSDLVEIERTFYGIETGQRYFYRLNPATARCEPIGAQLPQQWMTCMAYDALHDVLYMIDGKVSQLHTIDRRTGRTTPLGPRLPFEQIKGLAYHERSELLFAYEDVGKTIFTIDPVLGARTKPFLRTRFRPDELFDELDEHQGEIYGVKLTPNQHGRKDGQVYHVDVFSGEMTPVGPFLPDVSAHSLLIFSMPERLRWRSIEGPGAVLFADATAPATRATFGKPGDYVLELTVGPPGHVRARDRVRVQVRRRDCDGDGVHDGLALDRWPELDRDRDGVPDACQCRPAPWSACALVPASPDDLSLAPVGDAQLVGDGFELFVSGGRAGAEGLLVELPRDELPPATFRATCVRSLRWVGLASLDHEGRALIELELAPGAVGTSSAYRFLDLSRGRRRLTAGNMSDVLVVSFCP